MVSITKNGIFPPGSLATTQLFYPGTTNGRKIRKDVQPHADAMALAFALEFHKPLYATDGARDYATQVLLKAQKGVWAATPGTSNHGWGVAFDLASNVNVESSAEHKWMDRNAHKFGFDNPDWAEDFNPANGQHEPWHWEWLGGGSKVRVLPARKGEMGLGWQSDLVKKYQGLLNDKGSIRIVEDGDYGFMTGVAVAAVQKKAGIPVTGRMTPATKRYLLGQKAPDQPSKPAKPSVPVSVKADIIRVQNVVGAKKDGVWGKDTSRRVWALRQASAYDGHKFPYGVAFTQRVVGVKDDGVWGPASARAHTAIVKRLQAVLGVKADGVFGKKTRDALVRLENKAKK